MKKNFLEIMMDIADAAVESAALTQQMKEDNAKKKAAEAAFKAYNETLERELGYAPNHSYEKKYTRMEAVTLTVPAKYKYDSAEFTTATCRVFIKPKYKKIINQLNPALFMRDSNQMDIVWPTECNGYAIETKQRFGDCRLVVRNVSDGNAIPIVSERMRSSADLDARVNSLINKIKSRGYIEL